MRVPRTSRAVSTKLNLTPLIDVVFNLVIFFLVISHFSRGEAVNGVELPTATRGQQDESPHRLTITVQTDGVYLVAGKAVTTTEIEEMIAQANVVGADNFWVRIQGDRSAQYQLIEPIMLACARQAITNFGFDVLPETNKRGGGQP
ncbi:ExbD/TolR family protein [Planctomicrobium piriforme]|uniref:Biopolymer transport protein ExbD n=1 Tax=Planctomicrobium piriforme TaxID=1576369 RepID=A0A1I3B2B2_9PLAN|nr:biopolymer transporter ExbD [Planctomicrobium piriforme]SFH56478.1 biopolymer transport protein ExbD [Planctomicrobium piriforme]